MWLRISFFVSAIGLALIALPGEASAHQKWFTRDPNSYQVRWERFTDWPFLSAVVIAAVATGTALFIDKRWRVYRRAKNPKLTNALIGVEETRLRRLYAFLPLLLAIHTAIPLIANGIQLQIFAPNLKLEPSLISGFLGLGQIVVALSYVYGALTRYSSILLIVLFLVAMLFLPPVFVFEHINMVGIALFIFIVGRGPLSVDNLTGISTRPKPEYIRYALPALRWGTGLSIIWLALTEKLLNPESAAAFLRENLNFNFLGGFGITDPQFIALAGIGEFTMGVLLISGALPRIVILALWLPFNLTLPFLGPIELIGHLPIYATMLVLLVLNPSSHRATEQAARLMLEEAIPAPNPATNGTQPIPEFQEVPRERKTPVIAPAIPAKKA
jgi:uncharacterized membrane protein YphA (DoxX/SURF4 family)